MATLRRRELLRMAGQLGKELQLDFIETKEGSRFSGVYQRSIEASGGRYALITKSHEFTLVPWQTEMLKDGGCMRGFVKNNGPTIGVGGYDIA